MGIFKKIKDFYLEHRTVINCIGIGVLGGVGVGLAIGYSKGHDDGAKYGAYVSGLHDGCRDGNNLLAESGVDVDVDVDVDTPETKTETGYDDYMTKGWKEEYRADWNRVNKLAKSLNLEDYEMYIIEKNPDYGCSEPVVSHLVDNEPAYPAEEKPTPAHIDVEALTKNWSDEYDESWNKINELSENLDLKTGEIYQIVGVNHEGYDAKNLIHHVVDGEETYPPETTMFVQNGEVLIRETNTGLNEG